MVEIRDLKPGMFVKLVDDIKSCAWSDPCGEMHRDFAGKTIEIDSVVAFHEDVSEHFVKLVGNYWSWYADMIEDVYEEDPNSLAETTGRPDLSILFGGK
jgi:hypothetical protein